MTQTRPTVKLGTICIDCGDADQLAQFYSTIFGWEIGYRNLNDPGGTGAAGWVSLNAPDGTVGLCFQGADDYHPPTWPEQPGGQDKMMHFEIPVSDLESAVALAVAAGATIPPQPPDRDPSTLRVLLDPAGHPFCMFPSS